MVRRFVSIGGILVFASTTLLADFSYQQKSTLTGGMLKSLMKVAGVFSKQAREPIETTVSVKGDRMVTRSPFHVQIVDLAAETFTNVDLQKKTYSVMTFAEFKQAMDQMQRSMKQQQPNGAEVNLKISAEPTGASRNISGLDTKESIIKITMEATDPQTGKSGAMVVTTDAWIAPAANGYQEVREFHKRMAAKLEWAPGSGMFAGRPDVSKGMAESAKRLSDLDGMPVYEVVSMGGDGGPSGQQGNAQPQQQQQQQSAGSTIGNALGGRFGLGRKKQEQQQQQSANQSSSTNSTGAPNSLMEMTVEMSGFSSAAVDPSQFEIPGGFKKVEADLRRGR